MIRTIFRRAGVLSAFVFLLFFSVTAQYTTGKITGKVTEKGSQTGLSEVKIYITEKVNNTTDSTVTNSSGTWEYKLPITMISVEQEKKLQFSVSENNRNPYHSVMRMGLTVPRHGPVDISIYTIHGREIARCRKAVKAGSHSIVWHCNGSAGIYLVAIKTSNGSAFRRITLFSNSTDNRLGILSHTAPIQEQPVRAGSGLPIKITAVKFSYATHEIDTQVAGGEYFKFILETVHDKCIFGDLHNDILIKMLNDNSYHLGDLHTKNHTDIPRLQKGGVDFQLFAAFTSGSSSYSKAMKMADILKQEMLLSETEIEQAYTASDVYAISEKGKIAAIFCVEGGHIIENDLTKLDKLFKEGARYLTITWNNSTNWAVSAQDQQSSTKGLSDFGKQVIQFMDSLGIIIDVSHTGIKTIEDILTTTKNPIIASHSGARALRNHYRNLYDDQIKNIAEGGGVIGVPFCPSFLTSGTATVGSIVDHIDYIVDLVGIDHVGIGSDYDGIGSGPSGMKDVSSFPNLTLELLKREYTQEEIEKIAGLNFLRVFEQVCKP